MDDLWLDYAPGSGDPHRCPWHPRVHTSSPDGLHDTPCGECEAEMEGDQPLGTIYWTPVDHDDHDDLPF